MKDVVSLIDDIYQAGVDPSHWMTALTRICDALHGVDAVIGGITAGNAPLFLAPRTDPHWIGLYAQHYHARNPMQLAMMRHAPGVAAADSQLVDIDSFHAGDFYNEWCVPQGHMSGMAINFATSGGGGATMMISSRAQVEGASLHLLEQLAPHLARAFRMNQMLEENRAMTLNAFTALEHADRGVFLVSNMGTCTPANVLAQAIVARGDGLSLRDGMLQCASGDATRVLSRAIHNCITGRASQEGASLQVARTNRHLPLQIFVVPLPAAGWLDDGRATKPLVFVTDQEVRIHRKVERLRVKYQLTAAEAGVLRELACGGDREQISRRLGVSLATVRTQLTSIFDKTGVRRQGDVLQLLTTVL
jgi:DNA-binding CsgD family transcriptional regulator